MDEKKDVPFLEFSEVTLNIPDDELPFVSINIPCYKRRKFCPLMITNIQFLDYPKDKLEIVILQDGPESLFITSDHKKLFEECIHPAKLKYVYEPNIRRSIGDKRNRLVKLSSHKIIANIDSDDIYFPQYLRHSINAMKQYKVGITSSAAMLFLYPHLDFKLTGIRCGMKFQGHEACSVFTKKHFNAMGGFGKTSQGEGTKMIHYNEKNMVNLDIAQLMICVAHNNDDEGNTIGKDQFLDAILPNGGEFNPESPHIMCVKHILGLVPVPTTTTN